MQHLRDKHQLLTVAAGEQTLRFLPPLVIGEDLLHEGLDILEAAFAASV
jgi:acetylornithine/N-succinyldiaminopimelate aminotransferase